MVGQKLTSQTFLPPPPRRVMTAIAFIVAESSDTPHRQFAPIRAEARPPRVNMLIVVNLAVINPGASRVVQEGDISPALGEIRVTAPDDWP